MTENEIAQIVYTAYKKMMHTLGTGLLEKAYEEVLAYELRKEGLTVEKEVDLSLQYESLCVEHAYRIDLLVENKVIIELKAQDKLLPIHQTQLLTYLKLSNKKLGLLINFGGNSSDSFKRIINCTAITELDQDM
mgnify:CR=1 FL=1